MATYRGVSYDGPLEAGKQAASDLSSQGDAVDRRFAISFLNAMGAEALPHADALLEATADEDRGVRYWAAVTLAALEVDVPLASATALFQDADPGIRYYAAIIMGRLGPKASPAADMLLQALRDADPDVRVAAAKALLTVEREFVPAAVELLSSQLQEKFAEDFFRASAAEALGALGAVSVPQATILGEALRDRYPSVRKAAAAALKDLGPDAVRAAIAPLGEAADGDTDSLVRRMAGEAISLLGLPTALADADAHVRHWAGDAIVDLGPRAVEHAAKLAEMVVGDPDARVRTVAATALGCAGKAVAVHSEELTTALSDGDAAVRLQAAKALAVVNPGIGMSTAAIVARGLKEKDVAYRLAAAKGLREIGPSALHHGFALERCLEDEDEAVRLAAVRALLSVGRGAVKAAQGKLAELAKTDPEVRVRRAAATALEKCELLQRCGVPPPLKPLV